MTATVLEPAHLPHGIVFSPATPSSVGLGGAVKRCIDVSLALLALVLAAPILLISALAIKLDSRGPVLITQERVGQGMRTFRLLKLRSMVVNADELVDVLQPLNEATFPLFKMTNDPRITRVGRHLRRLSVDELPQLVNVLRGEMSLVGPRPPLPNEVECDYLRQSIRLRQPPGMTGLWQVSGRSELGYEDMIALDLDYMHGWSLLLDLKILLRTPLVVLTGRGAR